MTRLRVFLGIPTSPLVVLDRTQPALIGTRVLGLSVYDSDCSLVTQV